MPGPPRKSPDRRQHIDRVPVEIVRDGDLPVPPMPAEFRDELAPIWQRFWLSDVAVTVDMDTDLHVVERYFRLLHEELEAMDIVETDGRTVRGSQGQPVEHPMLKYISRLQNQMTKIEDRIGITSKSKATLGIAINRAVKDLEQRSQEAQNAEDEDPRIAANE